jgi:hypothetical protein
MTAYLKGRHQPGMKYDCKMRLTQWFSGVIVVEKTGFDTDIDALDAVMKEACVYGWSPPKWYQFWRWHDWPELYEHPATEDGLSAAGADQSSESQNQRRMPRA